MLCAEAVKSEVRQLGSQFNWIVCALPADLAPFASIITLRRSKLLPFAVCWCSWWWSTCQLTVHWTWSEIAVREIVSLFAVFLSFSLYVFANKAIGHSSIDFSYGLLWSCLLHLPIPTSCCNKNWSHRALTITNAINMLWQVPIITKSRGYQG